MAWSPTRVLPARCSVPPPRADGSRALPGGTANRGLVIRVGGTVLRPAAPCRPATHALLNSQAALSIDRNGKLFFAEGKRYLGDTKGHFTVATDGNMLVREVVGVGVPR